MFTMRNGRIAYVHVGVFGTYTANVEWETAGFAHAIIACHDLMDDILADDAAGRGQLSDADREAILTDVGELRTQWPYVFRDPPPPPPWDHRGSLIVQRRQDDHRRSS